MARVIERERQQLSNVGIGELVVSLPSVPFHTHDAVGTKKPEGVRHPRLAEADSSGNVPNPHWTLEQLDQNADPSLVAEQRKDVGHVGDVEVTCRMSRARGVGVISQVPS